MGLNAHTICLRKYIDFCGMYASACMCGYYCKAGCGGQAAAVTTGG